MLFLIINISVSGLILRHPELWFQKNGWRYTGTYSQMQAQTHTLYFKILNIKKETTMFKKICQGRFLKRCAAVVVKFTLLFVASCESAMRPETGRQAGSHQLRKGTATWATWATSRRKQLWKYDKWHTPLHTNELIQQRKFAEARCRDHRVRKDQYQTRFRNTRTPAFIHAYCSHKRLLPSNKSNMLAGEPAGFRLTMTRSCFPERSRPFCVEFACFRRCPPAAFLLAVERLIGDSEFPCTVGGSCECVRCDERPTWLAPEKHKRWRMDVCTLLPSLAELFFFPVQICI